MAAAGVQRPILCEVPLFAWETADRVASGVCGGHADTPAEALMAAELALAAALREAGAGSGTVRVCHLDPFVSFRYVYGGVVGRAAVEGGAVVWAGGRLGRFYHRVWAAAGGLGGAR